MVGVNDGWAIMKSTDNVVVTRCDQDGDWREISVSIARVSFDTCCRLRNDGVRGKVYSMQQMLSIQYCPHQCQWWYKCLNYDASIVCPPINNILLSVAIAGHASAAFVRPEMVSRVGRPCISVSVRDRVPYRMVIIVCFLFLIRFNHFHCCAHSHYSVLPVHTKLSHVLFFHLNSISG